MFTRSNRDKGKDAEAALRAEIVVLGLMIAGVDLAWRPEELRAMQQAKTETSCVVRSLLISSLVYQSTPDRGR